MIVKDYFDIVGNTGHSTGFIFVRRPISNQKIWSKVKKRFRGKILGMSSLCEFPRGYPKILKKCSGWCHVFREPQKFDIPKSMPHILLGESDFVGSKNITMDKKYDFCYVCLGSVNQRSTKNFDLFKQSLHPLCKERGLKCALIGMKFPKDLKPYSKWVSGTKVLQHRRVLEIMSASRFLFVPNIRDASPKIITEAMSVNVPCLINDSILGGWKYVNNSTGEFFHGVDDVGEMADQILSGEYSPKQWFLANTGVKNSGKRLLEFMQSIYPDSKRLKSLSYVTICGRDTSWFR